MRNEILRVGYAKERIGSGTTPSAVPCVGEVEVPRDKKLAAGESHCRKVSRVLLLPFSLDFILNFLCPCLGILFDCLKRVVEKAYSRGEFLYRRRMNGAGNEVLFWAMVDLYCGTPLERLDHDKMSVVKG